MTDKLSFEEWLKKAEEMLPWPDTHDVLEAIETCELDHAEARLGFLQELVKAHYAAARMGVFNDE